MKAFVIIITLAALMALQGCRAASYSVLRLDAERGITGEPTARLSYELRSVQ